MTSFACPLSTDFADSVNVAALFNIMFEEIPQLAMLFLMMQRWETSTSQGGIIFCFLFCPLLGILLFLLTLSANLSLATSGATSTFLILRRFAKLGSSSKRNRDKNIQQVKNNFDMERQAEVELF
jgi:hypothetical protein